MANVNHSSLTDPYLHEPKGTAAASVGQVYVADGAGSGSYTALTDSVSVVTGFDDSTPAHQHAITTTDSVLDLPSPTTLTNTNFTVLSSPNFRIQYGEISVSQSCW